MMFHSESVCGGVGQFVFLSGYMVPWTAQVAADIKHLNASARKLKLDRS